MNRTIVISLLTLCMATGSASARRWTLDQCIDHAVTHNLTVQQRALDRVSAKNSVTESHDGFLPQVSASASQSWNFGRGLTADNTYANRNTSNFGWNVGLNLPLFQGLQNVRQVAYAKANLAAVMENYEAAKDDVTLRVIAQYLQVLYCDEIEAVARNQAETARSVLMRQQARLDEGKIPEADMLDAKSQLAQAELQVTTAQSDRILARLEMIQLLRLNDESPEEFTVEPVADDTDPQLKDPRSVFDRAMEFNHTVGAMRSRISVAGQAVKVAQSGWIPRLSFNAGLSSNYYTLSGAPSESFSSQMRHNFGKYLGFSLSVPIFDALSTRNSVRRARVQKSVAELDFESASDELYKTVNQAYYQAVGARERLRSATIATQATQSAMDAMLEKYTLGRATSTDYDTARSAYIRAESDRLQAKYELLLRARILYFYATAHNY